MTFWTTQRIKRELLGASPPIVNALVGRVKNACYEMALGNEVFVASDGVKTSHKKGEQIRLPPGQFALLITEEELRMPLNLMALISIKASRKMSGLVNVSGFHVDPGFPGRLKFSVYNAGSETIVLEVGEPLFPIWFFEFPEDNEDKYEGAHKNQKSISCADVMNLQGEVASPAQLTKQIAELRADIANWKQTTVGVASGAILLAIASLFRLVS